MLTGLGLVVLHLTLAWLSPSFDFDRDLLSKPVLALVGIECLAGLIYLLAVWKLRDATGGRALMGWIIAVGLVLRLSLLTSTPMLEDDFYRYLWDGAVTANGFNPYSHAPASDRNPAASGAAVAQARHLLVESGLMAYCRERRSPQPKLSS